MTNESKWKAIKEDLRLNGVTKVHFYKSTWEDFDPHDPSTPVSLRYLIYRMVVMAWFIAGFLQGFCSFEVIMNKWYLTWLTNQTYCLQTIYNILSFSYVTYYYLVRGKKVQEATTSQGPRKGPSETKTKSTIFTPPGHQVSKGAKSVAAPEPESNRMKSPEIDKPPVLAKIIWVLLSILQLAAYFVSLGFWTIVVFEVHFVGFCENFQNAVVHASNSVFALVDTFVIAIPSRPIHCVFAACYALYYCIFTVIYEKTNGTYPRNATFIYSVIDWRDHPKQAIACSIGSIFASVIGFLIFSYGLYRLREFLRKRIKGERLAPPSPAAALGSEKTTTNAPEGVVSEHDINIPIINEA